MLIICTDFHWQSFAVSTSCLLYTSIWLGTNYGFTRYAPEGSVLEYFGPAPWYLLTLQIPALVVLRLLYLLSLIHI